MVAQVFHFYAGAVDKHHGETIPVAGGVDMTFREPLGVVGLIVPWNFPLNIASWKLGPALACGNTVVLKPAELTPLSALRLAELVLEAGIPEGVVNVVVGPGSVVGRRLVEHPDVAKIGFTGSTEVGRERHARRRRRRSSASRSSSAASPRTSSSPTPISSGPPRPRRTRSSTTPARTAARARASSSSARPTTASSSCSSRRRRNVQGRRSRGRGDRDGPADPRRAPRDGRVFRRRRAALPRRGAGRPGFWFPCTLVEASNDDRVAREEVFGPVAARDPVRRRGGRDPHRERHAVRPLRLDLDA